MSSDLVEQVLALCEETERRMHGGPSAAIVRDVRQRVQGPLRVAIAGRIKAGKSTMLNALVGERVAATDAGECTTIVTTYHRGDGYEVDAFDHAGVQHPLRMTQVDGAWHIDLGGRPPGDVERIDVAWPSNVLAEMTLIDTPGLASLTTASSRRSLDFLAHSPDDQSGADAVIYLMRHLHALDAEFLGAFMDRRVVGASPVNAIAVLARPDEIGGCRPDALVSADRIARRYAADPVVRSLVCDVVPVAGLLAETGQTLREREVAALRTLAATPEPELQRMLRSVDDLCAVSASDLTVETRRELLGRFGLFGLRLALDELRSGRCTTAPELARALVAHSGLAALQQLIRERFLPRARVLKARTALVALDGLARSIAATEPELAATIQRGVERIESQSTEVAQLTVAHLVMADVVRTSDAERAEIGAVLLATDAIAAARTRAVDEEGVLDAIERWRLRASDPRVNGLMVQTCETMAHVYERTLAGSSGEHAS